MSGVFAFLYFAFYTSMVLFLLRTLVVYYELAREHNRLKWWEPTVLFIAGGFVSAMWFYISNYDVEVMPVASPRAAAKWGSDRVRGSPCETRRRGGRPPMTRGAAKTFVCAA